MLQCFESSLPFGGSIAARRAYGRWLMTCEEALYHQPAFMEASRGPLASRQNHARAYAIRSVSGMRQSGRAARVSHINRADPEDDPVSAKIGPDVGHINAPC